MVECAYATMKYIIELSVDNIYIIEISLDKRLFERIDVYTQATIDRVSDSNL